MGKLMPDGFVEINVGRVHVWVRTDMSFLLDQKGDWRGDVPFSMAPEGVTLAGRDRMLRVTLGPTEGSCGLLRHYRRGGAFRSVLGNVYLGKARFFDEVLITEWARSHGVPTAEVLVLRTERVVPCFHRADLMTREISDAVDLDAHLRVLCEQQPARAGQWKKAAIRSVASLVNRMHTAGLFHADLNLKNILLRETDRGPESYIIDLDKSRRMDPITRGRKMMNLLRLYRSMEKQGHIGRTITLRDLMWFVRVYGRDDRDLVAECKSRIRHAPFSLKVHRLFWRLFGSGGRCG